VVSTDARPSVRSTFGPVSLAYEPKLKVVFRADRAGACGCVSVSAALRCVNSILPASWQIRPADRVYAPHAPAATRPMRAASLTAPMFRSSKPHPSLREAHEPYSL
jgi:hypothetical protein